jgi:acyl-CoA thioester hydrolase
LLRTHLVYVRESLIQFGYELVRASDGELLAEGDTTHIVVDRTMKKSPLPDKYKTAFLEAMAQ